MKLSKDFTLDEFLISQTAERHGIDMTPGDEIIQNLSELVHVLLQPLRDFLGVPIVISSGYRPEALNKLIGGSPTSAHCNGRAADFRAFGFTPLEVCTEAKKALKLYDQNIHEFGRWTHLAIAKHPRMQDLTAFLNEEGRTTYVLGLHKVEDLRVH